MHVKCEVVTHIIECGNAILPSVTIHKFIRDKYSMRFPELESLVPTPLEYIRTVQVITCILDAFCGLYDVYVLCVYSNSHMQSIANTFVSMW